MTNYIDISSKMNYNKNWEFVAGVDEALISSDNCFASYSDGRPL